MIDHPESLRIDWMPKVYTQPGQIGLSTLPGRHGRGRSIDDDMASLSTNAVSSVICLLSLDELAYFGVPDLLDQYRGVGFKVLNLPTVDQSPPSEADLKVAMDWIRQELIIENNVLIHCVGGLGRAGTVAACWLRMRGLSGEEAIRVVREFRSPRAIESPRQELAVMYFDPGVDGSP